MQDRVLGVIFFVCLGLLSHPSGAFEPKSALQVDEHSVAWIEFPCKHQLGGSRNLTCGALEVPENWNDPDSRSIILHVRIFGDIVSDERLPVLYLSGGPGQPIAFSGLQDLRIWEAYLDDGGMAWLGSRPLVVVAQRGTIVDGAGMRCAAFGDPRVYLGASTSPDTQTDWIANVRRENAACLDALRAQGHDLRGYSSDQSASDMVALRRVLGIERWSIFGVSYGTRLGFDVLERDGSAIDSAVFDSVFPRGLTDHWTSLAPFAGVWSRLFSDCRADTACNVSYPDLETRVDDLLKRLRDTPETVSVFSRDLGETIYFDLDHTGLIDVVLFNLYWPDTIAYLPMALDALSRGDTQLFLDLTMDNYLSDWGNGDWAFGMQTAVSCNDDFASYDPADVVAQQAKYPLFADWLGVMLDLPPCTGWPHGSGTIQTPVSSDIPILLMSGEFDPVTPPSYALMAKRFLPNAQVLRVPGAAHSVLDTAPCAIRAAGRFIADPTRDVSQACMERSARMEFLLP